jgi:hypothetical protein
MLSFSQTAYFRWFIDSYFLSQVPGLIIEKKLKLNINWKDFTRRVAFKVRIQKNTIQIVHPI